MTETLPSPQDTRIVTFKYNTLMPNAYSLTYNGETVNDVEDFVTTVDKNAREFLSTYKRADESLSYLIRELCHIASTSATHLNLNLSATSCYKLDDDDYHSHLTLFCLAVWILQRLNIVDGVETGYEMSADLIPFLKDNNDKFITIKTKETTDE